MGQELLRSFDRRYQFDLGKPKEFERPKTSVDKDESEIFLVPVWYEERDCDNELKEWLRRNFYGTLLLTGYRGVGKSSCVEFVLEDINRDIKKIETIRINFTTIFTLNSLTYLIAKEIGRKLGLEVDFENIPQEIRINGRAKKLLWLSKQDEPEKKLQYMIAKFLKRLSSTMELVSNSGNLSGSLKIGSSQLLEALGVGVGGLEIGGTSGGAATQKNYFSPFTESEIVSNLKDIIIHYVNFRSPEKRIIFVFDEIDKLKGFRTETEKEEEKIQEFEELVGKLKFILGNSRATFIFVAGKETYSRWQTDRSRGNSVYSSVFDHVLVVEPFLGGDKTNEDIKKTTRDKAEKKIKSIVCRYLWDKYPDLKRSFDLPFKKRDIYKSYIRYLLWKSRGIPRKIIHEVEYFIRSKDGNGSSKHTLYFDTSRIRKVKFYSGLVKDIYARIVPKENLENDGVLNLIILSEALFKFHRTGFNYSDLKWITVSVDQENEVTNEYYHDLAIRLLEGWWMETSYGKKARYVFKPNIKAAIDILSRSFQDESIIFQFEEKDFKHTKPYFAQIDTRVEDQVDTQRINSIRVQTGMAKINALMGKDFQAIEFYKKAVRLGIIELIREKDDRIDTGNTRALTRIMANCYLEMGHIFEKQRSLREAMSFYLSAFLVVYRSHINNSPDLPFDLESIAHPIDKPHEFLKELPTHEQRGSYYTIGEESVDALNHLAYIQWKFGKLDAAEKLFESAKKITEVRQYPYKIASQYLLTGFFFFRTGKVQDAKARFLKIITLCYGSNEPSTLLPHSIMNSTREAISCCTLSAAKNSEHLRNAFNDLEQVFFQIDTRADQREVVEIKLLKFRLYQRRLRSEKSPEITDNLHAELINNVFPLVRNRSGDPDYQEENPISIRLYYHLTGMVVWHIFAVIADKYSKFEDLNNIDSESEKILNEVNDLFKNCRSFFKSVSDKCLESNDHFARGFHNNEEYLQWSYLVDEKKPEYDPKKENEKKRFKESNLFWRIANNQLDGFKSLTGVFLFIEQVLLLCHRVFNKNIYTAAASDPADRLGFFYFWVYAYSQKTNYFPMLKFETIEKYFNYSVSEQDTYKRYLPDHAFPNIRSQLFLGDIFYLKAKGVVEEEEKYAFQRRCIHFYARAIFSLAKELELHFTRTHLLHTIFFKETKMVPRLRMYDIAETRYRLRSIVLRNEVQISSEWTGFVLRMPNELDFKKHTFKNLDLDDPECVQQYCFFLKRVANTKREFGGDGDFFTEGESADQESAFQRKIELLRKVLSTWRYRENLTDSKRFSFPIEDPYFEVIQVLHNEAYL